MDCDENEQARDPQAAAAGPIRRTAKGSTSKAAAPAKMPAARGTTQSRQEGTASSSASVSVIGMSSFVGPPLKDNTLRRFVVPPLKDSTLRLRAAITLADRLGHCPPAPFQDKQVREGGGHKLDAMNDGPMSNRAPAASPWRWRGCSPGMCWSTDGRPGCPAAGSSAQWHRARLSPAGAGSGADLRCHRRAQGPSPSDSGGRRGGEPATGASDWPPRWWCRRSPRRWPSLPSKRWSAPWRERPWEASSALCYRSAWRCNSWSAPSGASCSLALTGQGS